MKHQVLRWLRVSLGLLLFAAGGAAIGPVSQRIAGALPRYQP
jgi:hypothetical protein